MEYSKAGIALTERFEACSLTAYHGAADRPGLFTIGWGHTGPEVYEGLVWTQEQADSQLAIDDKAAVDCVNKHVTVALTQGEFDALVDFCFNCGCAAFEGSTILKLLNAGNYAATALEFVKWDHASGKVVAGLLRRREDETDEFNGVNA